MSTSSPAVLVLRPAELALIRLAVALGAETVGGPLSGAEARLVDQSCLANPPSATKIESVRHAIVEGHDPLGTALCKLRPQAERRETGAFYTPPTILSPMLAWVLAQRPGRLVDPGCGSGRFVAEAIRRQPDLRVVAIDIDPVATLLTRATLAVMGARDATVLQADYTALELPRIAGRTAFISNPPYVRHHALSAAVKAWAVATGRRLGLHVSALAGLHTYFLLETALHAQPGDIGCFVTSAEWLDVNYGSIIRHLLLGRLGMQALHVIDPRAVPFEGAMTTAAIACFVVGDTPDAIRFHLIERPADLRDLNQGHAVARHVIASTARWTPLLRGIPSGRSETAEIPLGTIARVHRGVATGANEFFVLTRDRARALGIDQWCRPAITSAEEVQRAGGVVRDGPDRRVLLCVPATVDRKAHPRLDAYLRLGEQRQGDKPPVSERYLPSHRRPWWYLGHCTAAPMVATYMARQAPVFALNPDGLVMVNIAHGIYPRHEMNPAQLAVLVQALNEARASFRGNGRTYHGGLEKFEPREMESLPIPAEVVDADDGPALFRASPNLG